MSNDFRFKDQIPKELTSDVMYKFQYGLCIETYYGKTVRHLVVRSSKHIGLSNLTNKKSNLKIALENIIYYYMITLLHLAILLAHEDKKFRLEIKESL